MRKRHIVMAALIMLLAFMTILSNDQRETGNVNERSPKAQTDRGAGPVNDIQRSIETQAENGESEGMAVPPKHTDPVTSLEMRSFDSVGKYMQATPPQTQLPQVEKKKGCVYNTVFNIGTTDENFVYKTPKRMKEAIRKGIEWLVGKQQKDGGWSAGNYVHILGLNPNRRMEQSDPATTALVSMAILRDGSTLNKGRYSDNLKRSLQYLSDQVDEVNEKVAKRRSSYRAGKNYTQIQGKLGEHVDLVLTAQYFANLVEHVHNDENKKDRILARLNKCVRIISAKQMRNGSFSGGTWASVLQSSLATNALESARHCGAEVDDEVLNKAQAHLISNFDAKSGKVNTQTGAGIILYSISGTVRASASRARFVNDVMDCARSVGELPEDAEVSVANLEKAGYGTADAMKHYAAYNVYQEAVKKANDIDVKKGFGNNGGEEYLSFLQTGEAMVMTRDESWKQWYDNTAGGLLKLQRKNGQWKGSHCISSPVFNTATCVLILSVNNDVGELLTLGDGQIN